MDFFLEQMLADIKQLQQGSSKSQLLLMGSRYPSNWPFTLALHTGPSHWPFTLALRTGPSHWPFTLALQTGPSHWPFAPHPSIPSLFPALFPPLFPALFSHAPSLHRATSAI
jgi:hypothetical protein